MHEASDVADCDLVEGLLYKYTNVVKGFQYRWFILDPSRGTLEYFMVSGECRRRQSADCHFSLLPLPPAARHWMRYASSRTRSARLILVAACTWQVCFPASVLIDALP